MKSLKETEKKMPVIYDSIALDGTYGSWDDDKRNLFNQRVKACTLMWLALQKTGILEKVAEKYEIFEGTKKTGEPVKGCEFIVDTAKLVEYRPMMESMDVESAALACQYIFSDEGFEIEPCDYSGAIETTWTMKTYRETCGGVGRSWEISAVKRLKTSSAGKVYDVFHKDGALAASIEAWRLLHPTPEEIEAYKKEQDKRNAYMRKIHENYESYCNISESHRKEAEAWCESWLYNYFLAEQVEAEIAFKEDGNQTLTPEELHAKTLSQVKMCLKLEYNLESYKALVPYLEELGAM